jgi:hypothetical protein
MGRRGRIFTLLDKPGKLMSENKNKQLKSTLFFLVVRNVASERALPNGLEGINR